MPTVADLLYHWDRLYDEERQRRREGQWRREDEIRWAGLLALSEGQDGKGRVAFERHRALGHGVVCDCPPCNGYQWPAKLDPAGDAWICGQHPPCHFYLPVEETGTNEEE